jgi:DNA-binding transcriptional LysR family regulator
MPIAWLNAHVPPECLTLFGNDLSLLNQAVREGVGIGFFPMDVADGDPALLRVLAPLPEWEVPIWVVTHVDLHRSAKVQAFLREVWKLSGN